MFFVGPIRDLFSQLKKEKTNIHTSKFEIRQISKSPDDIHTKSSDSGGAQKNYNHILGPKLNVKL